MRLIYFKKETKHVKYYFHVNSCQITYQMTSLKLLQNTAFREQERWAENANPFRQNFFSHFLISCVHGFRRAQLFTFVCCSLCTCSYCQLYSIMRWSNTHPCLIFQQILHFCVEIRRCPFDWINLLSFPGICLGWIGYKKAWFQLLMAIYKVVWKVLQTMQQGLNC